MATSPSAAEIAANQAEHWNGAGGQRWADVHGAIEAFIGPLGTAGVDALAPRPGEAVVDVGCGFGSTAAAIGRRVTKTGRVLGIDLSGPQLEVARAQAEREGLAHVRFAHGDVAAHVFEGGAHDAAFSRFGVMFFPDPVGAFANLRSGLARGGRLVFVCWRAMEENEWVKRPLEAATKHLPPPELGPPGGPGPFSLADDGRIAELLGAAGYVDVAAQPLDLPLRVGDDPAQAAELLTHIGPVSRMVAEVDETSRAAVAESVRETLADRGAPQGVFLQSAAWLVTARAG